jgi:hypothetical protein
VCVMSVLRAVQFFRVESKKAKNGGKNTTSWSRLE